MKYKIGDKVRVVHNVSSAGWAEQIEVGKIYKIVLLDRNYNGALIFVPNMGRDGNTWWLDAKCLELVAKSGEQLEFAFMYEEE